MNKNIIVIAGVVVSLVAVVTLFIADESIDINTVSIDTSSKVESKELRDNSKIEYKTTKNKTVSNTSKSVIKKERPKREKFVELQTYDHSHKFEISLINPNQDLTKSSTGFKKLKGYIDGEAFYLRVPNHLIQEGTGSMQLRVKNLETGEISLVSAAFIDSMLDQGTNISISMSSDDIENYEQQVVKQIVPPRPGEAIN
jgi:hypothetical protein